MKTLQLNESLYWIGIQDHDLRVFDIIMETKFGTSYNSYLLKTDEGVILFETAKETFFDEYLEKINELTSVDQIKYIVCNHTEPDHSGSISKLLELNPNIEIISTTIAKNNIQEIINHDFLSKTIKDCETLQFGDKTLQFFYVPNLHWPDTMYTYIQEDQVLLTCDSFGAHYAHDQILASTIIHHEDYQEAFDYYTKMILGPFKPFILKAMKKIENLNLKLICPGHGPVIDQDFDKYINYYLEYGKNQSKEHLKVVIPFVSAYGYTKMIAKTIEAVLKENDIICHVYDLETANMTTVIDDMISADGILYGSPTLLNDALPPIYQVMNAILQPYHGTKVVSAFGSYGWSGEAVPNLITRLKQQRMKVTDEGFKVKFKPSPSEIEAIKTYTLNYISYLK